MNKNIIEEATAIDVYKMVLDGRLKRFPNGFWCGNDGLENGRKISKYLIEDILRWTKEEIQNNLVVKTFSKHKLGGMLKALYNQSPFLVLDSIYPGEFKEWYLKNTPKNYWTNSTAQEAIQWLMDKNSLSEKELISTVTKKMLSENNLGGLLDYCDNSPYNVLLLALGDTFKPWDMISTPNGYWNEENAIAATKYLFEDVLKWTDDDIKNKLNKGIFYECNLGGMLSTYFNDSPYMAISTTYPGRFLPEDLKNKPKCA